MRTLLVLFAVFGSLCSACNPCWIEDDGFCGEPTSPLPDCEDDPLCDDGTAPVEEPLSLELTGDTLDLNGDATAFVTLYGYDRNIADQAADVVRRVEVVFDAFPLELELEFADAHIGIFGDPAPEDARFYFGVGVDVDGDGRVCAGDLEKDYDAAGGVGSFGVDEVGSTFSIPVIERTATGCIIE